MGNEEKLDTFYFTLKRERPDLQFLFHNGFKTDKYHFSINEVEEYMKRFRLDLLLDYTKSSYLFTPKGETFKGYRLGWFQKLKNYIIHKRMQILWFVICAIAGMSWFFFYEEFLQLRTFVRSILNR